MYTKQEASKLREGFWTAFGQYMRPVLSADGLKINWVNYKTGIPGIRFEMKADDKQAAMAIVLNNNNADTRHTHYDQLARLKAILEESTGEQWLWQPEAQDEYGRQISRIGTTLKNVNIYKNEDWPQIISFFKPLIIALDDFWSIAKYGFEGM